MIAQFRRLLEKIAEENKKLFARGTLRIHTLHRPHYEQMGKLRAVKILARPCQAQEPMVFRGTRP
jgi:hypothetical protein